MKVTHKFHLVTINYEKKPIKNTEMKYLQKQEAQESGDRSELGAAGGESSMWESESGGGGGGGLLAGVGLGVDDGRKNMFTFFFLILMTLLLNKLGQLFPNMTQKLLLHLFLLKVVEPLASHLTDKLDDMLHVLVDCGEARKVIHHLWPQGPLAGVTHSLVWQTDQHVTRDMIQINM
ncbi:hypothetical protein Hamer_G017007 [Homarus americanus]|uniref:Uncharacterized protein n=1 Tax=Homarus americanus TaxID=6706 RepID=A0A8J5TNP0_HOMAM|nr:hypothetical protein Hamer_G017007 [Homarus americanus]